MTINTKRKKSDIREWAIVMAFLLFIITVVVLKEVKKYHACRFVHRVESRAVREK